MAKTGSLKKIAELSGVSVSSVSQILNNRACDYSSEETRERVRKVAESLGYRKNFGYQLLHGQTTHTIAVVLSLPRIGEDENIREILMRLLTILDKKDFASYIVTCCGDEAANSARILELLSRGVEHFIFLGSPLGHKKIIATIRKSNSTFICLNTGGNMAREVVQNAVEARLAIYRYLLEKSGDDFKVVALPGDPAFRKALRLLFPDRDEEEVYNRYLIELNEVDTVRPDFRKYYYEYALKNSVRLYEENGRPRALAFSNDDFALGAANALAQAGYKIGHDILIAGFNNDIQVQRSLLPVTTIALDLENAVNKLVDEMSGTEPCRLQIPQFLVIREPDEAGGIRTRPVAI